MTYAQIVQGIAKSCGDESAIDYDEKFRQWRQVAPQACPWNLKNMELFQDAMITSIDTKSKFKKQPFRANSGKQKYCFSFNNKGSCNKANSCTYAHICQYCAGRHSRLQCSKNRSNFSNISQPKSVLPDSSKKQPIQNKSNCTITTPIDSDAFAKYLEGYDPELSQFLVTGFSLGFRIPYVGERKFRLSNNLPSFEKNKSVGLQKISQELCTGRIAGPFSSPPFTNIQVSPLGIVPKKNPGEFRMIHHLSYPKGSSINDHIPAQYCSVQYQSIDHGIAAIKRIGVGALLSKSDLENAYKQVPIHPDDFELLGFLIEGSFYSTRHYPLASAIRVNFLKSLVQPFSGY